MSFWEDVLAKATEALERTPKFDHYMGALILAPEPYAVAVTPRLQIVDGQQRLTTFQLFLVALREAANALGHGQIGEAVHNYLFLSPMSGDTSEDARFKLMPNRADRATIYRLLDSGLTAVRAEQRDWFFQNGKAIKKYAPKSVQAVEFFEQRIRKFAQAGFLEEDDSSEPPAGMGLGAPPDGGPDIQLQRLSSLATALLNHLKLVVITLGDNDDAQVIFESLNSKIEPLTAMELVRNNIFQRAAAEGEAAEELFETLWKPLEGRFWQDPAPLARPRRPRIDHYLSHALTAQTGEEISLRELYAEYRAFSRPKGRARFGSVEKELNALLRYTDIYRALEGEGDNPDLRWIGERLTLWEVTTAYPLIFAVGAADITPEEKRSIYELLNSYLVRRGVCGLTPKNLNKNFQRMVAALLREGISLQTLVGTFKGQAGDSVRFPTDSEFREAVRMQPLYRQFHRKDRLREILWDLECAMRDKFTVNAGRPSFISVEHIMPQHWMTHWPLPNGSKVTSLEVTLGLPDEATRAEVQTRERLVHALGNLTLATISGNTAASNSDFANKKEFLGKSLLAMNTDIIGRSDWTEETILARGSALADLAVRVWPAPLAG